MIVTKSEGFSKQPFKVFVCYDDPNFRAKITEYQLFNVSRVQIPIIIEDAGKHAFVYFKLIQDDSEQLIPDQGDKFIKFMF